MKNLKSRSPYLGHVIMAIAISLICNFSYLLLLVSSQTGATGNRRINSRLERGQESAIVEGKLTVCGDGFGYIVTEQGDSIYLDHRNLHRLALADGDTLVVQAAKRRSEDDDDWFEMEPDYHNNTCKSYIQKEFYGQ